jgi:hypothetical protein
MQLFFSLFALVFHALVFAKSFSFLHILNMEVKKQLFTAKKPRDGILGQQLDKRLKHLVPCYLQVSLADFKENPYATLVLKIHTKKSTKQDN